MTQGVGGEGGAHGGRDPNAGGKGPKGGGGNGAGKGPRGVGGEGGAQGGRDPQAGAPAGRGPGGHGGQGAVGSATAADRLMADKYGVSPDRYNQETTDYRDRLTDAYGTDDSMMDVIGNFLGSMVGFNEQTPDEVDFDPQNPTGPDVSWGFDPVGPMASAAGMLLGGPLGPGLVADKISEYFGRPLEVDLGPSVFGFDGGETVTGPTTGVRDPGGGTGNNTYFGLPPEYAQVANLVSGNAAPRPVTNTYTGTDQPTTLPPDPAPPTAELPIDSAPAIPPSGANIDPGNTGLSPTDLTELFAGYLPKQTTSTGKNRMRLVA